METLFVALRVLLSLGAVLALLWLLQRRFARGGAGAKGKARTAASLAVVGRQNVGPKASVVVVEHDGNRFLLGVTEHGVNVLHTAAIAPDAAVPDAAVPEVAVPDDAATLAHDEQSHAHFAQVLADAGESEDLHAPSPITGLSVTAPELVDTPAGRRVATVAAPQGGRLAGSILAPETWKQAAAVVRDRW